MKLSKYAIIPIVLLAALLRFNQLGTLPALNADEAAIGYNAYSLLETGKDEHGNPWPVHFQSFNDYKPGLYFYLAMPFVKILGLNILSVRLPGALLGIATVFVLWLLARKLFPDRRGLPEIAALFLTISPWHIHFSRGGWEVNVATFLTTTGVWLLIKAQKDRKIIYLSAISFVASIYTYHAARIVVPLLLLGSAFYWRKTLRKGRSTWVAVALGVLLLLPLGRDLFGPAGISRAAGVGLFADLGPYNKTNEQRGEHTPPSEVEAQAFHNKLVNYGIAFAQNYGKHFSGDFLFLSGDDIQRDKVPEFGQMYLFDIIFLLAGFGAIFAKGKMWFPILWWLIVAPTAAALTFQSPHALRSQNMVIPLTLISAYGLWSILHSLNKSVKNKKLAVSCYILLVALIGWDFSRYLHQYYFHMTKTFSYSSQYGAEELVGYIRKNESKYFSIVTTTRYDQPYILFLFYLQYPPEKFQKEHNLTAKDGFGFSTVEKFGKFTFLPTKPWDKVKQEYKGALVAGAAEDIPDAENIIKTIYFPGGEPAYKIIAN